MESSIIVRKTTSTATDIIIAHDGESLKFHREADANIDAKYRKDIENSILYKTGGLKIIENRTETLGNIEAPNKEATIEVDTEREALMLEAKELGLKIHPKSKNETIKKLIEEKKTQLETEAESNE